MLVQILTLLAALFIHASERTPPAPRPTATHLPPEHSGWMWVPEHYKRGKRVRGHWRRM